ncbi:9626_t:CDS:2 [Funneliformis geosporum]|uniref:17667_t:CDS:1 n=1 Tax=Funneliformis geosporum TaxID=1117311 RepID=A0A9W4WSV7_9GLOM|nr:9626_t:CDS:2 [Funneliformis geosporum]CAI2176181.1 17667_t:CDS:2 [Funneliformis geosporum]
MSPGSFNGYPTYAYDFPKLFRQAIRILWNHASYLIIVLWKPKNLVLDGNNNLQEVERASGTNSLQPNWQARSLGIPRTYLSANSGARIGLSENTYKQLYQNGRKFVIAEEIVEEGESRHKSPILLDQKIGLVIGACLVRLGQRTIQNEGRLIMLTGAPALNNELGQEVYTGDLEGTQIMLKNGVSHLTAQNDLEAIQFADLHDTPGRMKSKETIRKSIEWKESRRFLYWRVRRRLHEEFMFRDLIKANDKLTRNVMKQYLINWFKKDNNIESNKKEFD